MFITGCSSSINDVRSDDNFVSRVNASPDIIELDAELNALDIETENLEASKAFTLSFVDRNTLTQSDYFGLVSGKLVADKIARVGFTVTSSPNVNAPIIKEYPLTLECKVRSFKDGILIGEVVNMSAEERILTGGKVDLDKLQPVVFDASANVYRAVGEAVGHAWQEGKVYMDNQ